MINRILLLVLCVYSFSSCFKNDNNSSQNCNEVTVTATESEVLALKTYIDSNKIIATKDPRGFYYHMDSVTSGQKPNLCNTLTVAYKGNLLNGVLFDQSNSATFGLRDLIVCWQEAIPLMGVGGTMTIYTPPSLAYGSSAVGSIPANSYLKFVITLKAVN